MSMPTRRPRPTSRPNINEPTSPAPSPTAGTPTVVGSGCDGPLICPPSTGNPQPGNGDGGQLPSPGNGDGGQPPSSGGNGDGGQPPSAGEPTGEGSGSQPSSPVEPSPSPRPATDPTGSGSNGNASPSPPPYSESVDSPTSGGGNNGSEDGSGNNKPTSGGNSNNEPSGSSSAVCSTTDGDFGSQDGRLVSVSFGYELETKPVNDFVLFQEVLPPLEAAFANYLLPIFFEDDCSSKSGQNGVAGRRLQVVGISALPDDLPILDIVCSTLKDDGNDCLVMLGEISLYLDGRRLSSEDDVRKALKKGMRKGEFVEADERIVRVSYVDLAVVDTSFTGGPNGNSGVGSADGGISTVLVGLVVVAATGFILIGAMIAYRRRSRQNNSGEDPLDVPSSGPDSPDSDKNSMLVNNGTGLDETENGEAQSETMSSVYMDSISDAATAGLSRPNAVNTAGLADTAPEEELQSPADDSVYLDDDDGPAKKKSKTPNNDEPRTETNFFV